MKNIFVSAVVVCFSLISMAQNYSVSVDLNKNGTFTKSSSLRIRSAKSPLACKNAGGVMTKKYGCVRTYNTASVNISNFGSDEHIVRISSGNQRGSTCEPIEGLATDLNPVQMVLKQNACELTIGFENQDTLNIMTNGMCADVLCGAEKSFGELKRVGAKK